MMSHGLTMNYMAGKKDSKFVFEILPLPLIPAEQTWEKPNSMGTISRFVCHLTNLIDG
jgi:hypothetical protein